MVQFPIQVVQVAYPPILEECLTLHDAANRFERVRQARNKPGLIARCPSCAIDGRDSRGEHLYLKEDPESDSRRYWHVSCISGCNETAILAAAGLRDSDRRIDEPMGAVSSPKTHVYQKTDGSYAFEKVKYEQAGGDKGYFQLCKLIDGKPAAMVKGKTGRMRYPTPTEAGLNGAADVLYRYPEIAEAIRRGETIYVGEGEKAADVMWIAGLAATCQPHGAGIGKWKQSHTTALSKSKRVVIVCDRDDVGELYSPIVFCALRSAGVNCVIVRSRTEGKKDDGYDHVMAGFGADDFVVAEDLMPPDPNRTRRRASEIKPQDVPWLAYPYLALGMLAGIEGDPGSGKSFIGSALATAVSVGAKLPFCEDAFPVGRVLMYMTEDSSEFTTVPRLQKFGANLELIEIDEEVFPLDLDGLARLKKDVSEVRPILVIIDPITAFIDAATKGTKAVIDVHGIMNGLKAIASEFGCCIVCLRHLRKSNVGDTNAIYAGIGDISIIGKYRTALQIRRNPDKTGQCVIAHVKSNVGPIGQSFGYEVRRGEQRDEYEFLWTGFTDATAESLANPQAANETKAVSGAKEFLTSLLTGQVYLQRDVMRIAKENGYCERVVRAAKVGLGVKSSNYGYADKQYRWTIEAPDPFAEPGEEEYRY